MLKFLKDEMNKTLTENGAVAHATTQSDCLDFFATVGAIRKENDGEIIKRFERAYAENADLAVKTLFFARDVRGGLGERRVFRTILGYLATAHPDSVRKNVAHVAEYGRYDDILTLFNTPCEKSALDFIDKQLHKDLNALAEGKPVSLLGKWLPSVNTSNAHAVRTAKRIAKSLEWTDAQYRKTLVALRRQIRLIENNLREKDYTFDYSAQPSKAMRKYFKAFMRNDGERFREFLSKVEKGEAKLNAGTLAPYELVEPYLSWECDSNTFMKSISPEEERALNASWASLPDYGCGENVLPIIDTSGSMYLCARPMPASVALSLGLYCAERNVGAFKNHFIEFSARPKLIEIKGDTFTERLRYVASFNEVANTNLEAVFDVILKTAVKCNLPQSELPERLIIISDMEFDSCVDGANDTVYDSAKKKYQAHGYKLPEVVFWNVASRHGHQPVTKDEHGVSLVSGASPKIFEAVACGTPSPQAFMMSVLDSERYRAVVA